MNNAQTRSLTLTSSSRDMQFATSLLTFIPLGPIRITTIRITNIRNRLCVFMTVFSYHSPHIRLLNAPLFREVNVVQTQPSNSKKISENTVKMSYHMLAIHLKGLLERVLCGWELTVNLVIS